MAKKSLLTSEEFLNQHGDMGMVAAGFNSVERRVLKFLLSLLCSSDDIRTYDLREINWGHLQKLYDVRIDIIGGSDSLSCFRPLLRRKSEQELKQQSREIVTFAQVYQTGASSSLVSGAGSLLHLAKGLASVAREQDQLIASFDDNASGEPFQQMEVVTNPTTTIQPQPPPPPSSPSPPPTTTTTTALGRRDRDEEDDGQDEEINDQPIVGQQASNFSNIPHRLTSNESELLRTITANPRFLDHHSHFLWDDIAREFNKNANHDSGLYSRSWQRLESSMKWQKQKEKKSRLDIDSTNTCAVDMGSATDSLRFQQLHHSNISITASHNSSSASSSSSSSSSNRSSNVASSFIIKSKEDVPFTLDERSMIKEWGTAKKGDVTEAYLFRMHKEYFYSTLQYARTGRELKKVWDNHQRETRRQK